MKKPGFFDVQDRLQDLSKTGDPLEKITRVVNFEIFRPEIEKAINIKANLVSGGRPPWDAIVMIKVLVLQSLYTLSDDQTEYQIKDRFSFMRFAGLKLYHGVPDAKTIWNYREKLRKTGVIDKIFKRFDQELKKQGYLAMGGQIIDASVVQAPRQRMTKEEKKVVKEGKTPEAWDNTPAKKAQKDMDARWFVKTKKAKTKDMVDLGIPQFGYKNNISIDRRHKLIRSFEITPANSYDGHVFEALLDKDNTASSVFADSAYAIKANKDLLNEKGYRSCLHRKKQKGKPMPKHIKRGNGTRSKVRARVEHIFATQKTAMRLFVRTIRLKRAQAKIGLANLAYNMKRLIFLSTQAPQKHALTG